MEIVISLRGAFISPDKEAAEGNEPSSRRWTFLFADVVLRARGPNEHALINKLTHSNLLGYVRSDTFIQLVCDRGNKVLFLQNDLWLQTLSECDVGVKKKPRGAALKFMQNI